MTRRIAGVITLRVAFVEERGLALIPGSTSDGCYRCGEELVVTPAMQGLRREHGAHPWCWNCVWEVNPGGFNLAATQEIIDEAALLHRLNTWEGPIQ